MTSAHEATQGTLNIGKLEAIIKHARERGATDGTEVIIVTAHKGVTTKAVQFLDMISTNVLYIGME